MYFQFVGEKKKKKEYITYCLQWVIQKAGIAGGKEISIVFCMFIFCKFHPELKQKEYSMQPCFGHVRRLSSRREPQGYAEQCMKPGVCLKPGPEELLWERR